MAEATKVLGEKKVTRYAPTIEKVVLSLNPPEAIALRTLVANVTGNPTFSVRKFTKQISNALHNAGVPYATGTTEGFVRFRTDSDADLAPFLLDWEKELSNA